MNYETARHHMIEQQLRTCELLNPSIIAQLYSDRRESYVPAAYRALAFADIAIPLGEGDAAMLTPKLEARLLLEANLQGGERVLEIGTGSGHMAALLAERAQQVWTMEINPTLADRARSNLKNAGMDNVTVETGDGLAGLPTHAPFDLIIVSGGLAELPIALLAQLTPGGRLLAFVGTAPVMHLRRVIRQSEGADVCTDLLETTVPTLHNSSSPKFSF